MRPIAALLLAGLLSACGHRGETLSLREPDTASRLRIAAAAAAAGQTDIALSMYSAAASAAPNNVEAQTRLASLLLKVGKPDMADEVLRAALGRKPNDPSLLRWRGVLLLQTGDTAGAAQVFDGLIARDRKDIGALNGRGMALDIAGRHGEAQQAYRTALAISPDDLPTSNNLAVSLLLSDQPAAARDVLLPLSRRPDVPPRLLNNLAIAEAASGDVGGSNALLANKIGADDIRALAASFGAPAPLDDAVTPPDQIPAGLARPTG